MLSLAQIEAALLLTTWVVHALGMLGCLTRKKPRGSIQGTIVTIVLLFLFGSYGSVGFYFGAHWLLDEDPRLNFFGRMIPWLAWILIYELPALGFLGLAVGPQDEGGAAPIPTPSPRRWRAWRPWPSWWWAGSGRSPGSCRRFLRNELTSPMPSCWRSVYVLSLAAMVLSVTITPGSGEYLKGVRRALRVRAGGGRVPGRTREVTRSPCSPSPRWS